MSHFSPLPRRICSWLVNTEKECETMDAIPPSLRGLNPHCAEKLWSNGGGRHSRYQWGQHQRKSSTSNGMWGVFKAYSHKFFICIRLWGRRGGRPAGLQLKASNNNPGLFADKRWMGGEGHSQRETTKILCLQYVNKKRFLQTESTISRCSWKIHTTSRWQSKLRRRGRICDTGAKHEYIHTLPAAICYVVIFSAAFMKQWTALSGRDYITIPKTWVMSMYTPLTTSLGTTAQSLAIQCSL